MTERNIELPRFVLHPEEAEYLDAWVHGTVDKATVHAKRMEGIYVGHLMVLLEAARFHDQPETPVPMHAPHWPWPTREALEQRLMEACDCLRGGATSAASEYSDGVALFRQEEHVFLLRWYQERNDRFFTPGHCYEWYPASRALREFDPSMGETDIYRMCFVLLLTRGLSGNAADGLLLPKEPPPIPWSSVEELHAKYRAIRAYWPRKSPERMQQA